ncbi:MAG: fibro-slime domain-containing protein [Lachnospiraceae bacterium]|nr:fibro-slime domain-containing protein [Lachnospiraceae bacterium]
MITYQGKEADSSYTVTEFSGNGGEGTTIESTSEYSVESGEQTIKFAMDASTDYAISSVVETETEDTTEEIEPKTLTYEGEDYIVTVTYGSDAELPDNVELLVSEYAQDSEIYLARYAEAAALYGWNSENSGTEENADNSDSEIIGAEDEASSISEDEETSSETVEASESTTSYHGFRLFNIGLYVDGEEIEPSAAVTVTISYLGKDAWESYSVTHFAEEDTKNVDATSNYEEGNQTITFDADGFSDWGISLTADEDLDYTVAVGKTITITGTKPTGTYTYTYRWGSSDTSIATVSYAENVASVTGVSAGTVTITYVYEYKDRDQTTQVQATYTVTVTAAGSIVLNLGNGNGILQDSDYSGGSQGSGGTDLRYTVNVADAAAEDGTVTINLPSDSDLDTTFTVATDSEENDITQDLGNEAAPYAWKLVGWVNIATGTYYDVSGGSVTATVDLADSNVFYADWIAESYDYGLSSSLGVDTSDFVKIEMFDYNELFNLYSATLTQSGLTSESWADSGSLYSGILHSGGVLDYSFIFHNSRTNNNSDKNSSSNGLLGYVTGLNSWNSNNEQPYTVWTMSSASGSPVLNKLYDTSGSTIGVTYVGSANYLFQVDDEGYYYFDSDQNGAAYNQSAQRFYLSSSTTTVNGSDGDYGTAFFPYNKVDSYTSISDGTLNYWFGMSVEMDFYLPNDVGTGGNQYNDEDMVFEFSGDDDVWVFVDDELVLNISGVHSEMKGSINFSTGEVTVKTGDSVKWANYSSTSTLTNCTAGTHTLKVYYMERGAWDSNLSIKFNVVPRWQYETATAGTMSVTKTWSDGESSHSAVTMGLFEKTDVTVSSGASEASYNGVTYTLTDGYSYDENTGYVNAYVSGGYLYVLVDTEKVSEDNDWTYTWELLDSSKTYEVLELTTLSNYKTTSTYSALQEYNYWSAVGYEELNGTVTYSNGTYSRTGGILQDGLEILLTDGAQSGTATSDFPTTYTGYVIDSGDSISTVSAQFSQAATLNSSGTYTYGVTSDTYISDSSVWKVELTGNYASFTESGQAYYAPTFYLKDSSGNYLAITGSSDSYSLTTVSSSDSATAFSYNSLGELNTEGSTGLKVTISSSGSYALVKGRLAETDTENVKIYVKQEVTTTGKSYTITNTLLPTITLKKVDSTDGTKNLSGAVFTLQNSEGEYYSYTDNAVNWSSEEQHLTTDNNGVISFTALLDGTYILTEVTAPDGDNLLSCSITVVVENGVVVSGLYGSSESSIVSIDDGTGLIITIQNTPGVELPSTGGFGVWMYTIAGMLILLSAAYLMYKKLGRKGDMSY